MLPVRKTTKRVFSGDFTPGRKRRRCVVVVPSSVSPAPENTGADLLDSIPDDLVVSILCKLGSTSRCPADFINVLMT